MLQLDLEIEEQGLFDVARQICLAARTAPKGRGKDLLTTAIVTGKEKDQISLRMRDIGQRSDLPFFIRDAANLDSVELLVLVGTRKEPLDLPNCGFCGFTDCRTMLEAGGCCSFNTGDLGIALGSAVSRAADMRVDNRIMYTVGKAVLELGLLSDEIKLVYGIPLSATGKSPFFDRS